MGAHGPELEHRPDGSLWFRTSGEDEWEQVADAGTDVHSLRFAEVILPIANLAAMHVLDGVAQDWRGDDHVTSRQQAVEELLSIEGADDHALCEAAWMLERDARRDGDEDLARAADLVGDAVWAMRHAELVDHPAYERFRAAVSEWRSAHPDS